VVDTAWSLDLLFLKWQGTKTLFNQKANQSVRVEDKIGALCVFIADNCVQSDHLIRLRQQMHELANVCHFLLKDVY
jgi:hypothetical protein